LLLHFNRSARTEWQLTRVRTCKRREVEVSDASERRGGEGETHQVAQKSMIATLSPPMMVLNDSKDSIAATMFVLCELEVREGRRGRRSEQGMGER
jgi:hypothetical protein